MRYLVTWEIDAYADSPTEAAEYALSVQRDPTSTATVFKVFENGGPQLGRPVTIDLDMEVKKRVEFKGGVYVVHYWASASVYSHKKFMDYEDALDFAKANP